MKICSKLGLFKGFRVTIKTPKVHPNYFVKVILLLGVEAGLMLNQSHDQL
jgi:hypothetical protein